MSNLIKNILRKTKFFKEYLDFVYNILCNTLYIMENAH